MDLGSTLFCVCVTLVFLLAAAGNAEKTDCPCPAILPLVRPNLEPPPNYTCFRVNDRYRYRCISFHLRKAGTSNLITCKEINGNVEWIPPFEELTLQCIRDPKLPTTPPPTPGEDSGTNPPAKPSSYSNRRINGTNNDVSGGLGTPGITGIVALAVIAIGVVGGTVFVVFRRRSTSRNFQLRGSEMAFTAVATSSPETEGPPAAPAENQC